jgi:periplasmic divalent cation tolerance protein
MVLIYTTCRDEESARKFAGVVIEKKLASCVNIWRIGSIYRWEGQLKEEKEVAVLIKTLETKVQKIEDLISSNHEYAVPFVGTLNVFRINRGYKEWMTTVIE